MTRKPTNPQTDRPRRVAMAYHFFAHYRGPILSTLLHRAANQYLFAGDRFDPYDGTVKGWCPPQDTQFILMRCKRMGIVLWQPGVLRLAMREIDTFIFLGNMYMIWTWLAVIIARLRGKRVLFWTHGWRTPEKGLRRWIRNRFYRLAHGLLLYEHYAKNIAIAEGFLPENVHVVYNSLDYHKQVACRQANTEQHNHATRERLFKDPRLPVVLCSSRLVKRRKFEQVIEAVRILKDQQHPLNLLFIGDGPERENLIARCDQYQIDAHFHGACYDESELAELFGCATVTVSPGPVGLMVIHSFVYGRPIIASDDLPSQGPEWGTIMPGRNGDLFRNDDLEDLARTIRRWTDQITPDPAIQRTCQAIPDLAYNPDYQARVIDRAVEGLASDDLLRPPAIG